MYDSLDSILAEGAESNDIYFKETLRHIQRNSLKLSFSDQDKLREYIAAPEEVKYRMRRESLDKIKEYKRNIQRMADLIEKAKKSVATEKEEMKSEIKKETAELVVLVVEKLLNQKLDGKADEKFIQDILKSVK
jgi:F0F1-type ATP synthase membrane subunit b/b'